MTGIEKYPPAIRLGTAMAIVEDVYSGLTGDYEEAYDMADAAVYLQVAVDRLVWRLNVIKNGEEDKEGRHGKDDKGHD